MNIDGMDRVDHPKDYDEPLLHHILYVESDAVQIERYGFLRTAPKSIWVLLENTRQLKEISNELASLFYRGRIKLYYVAACEKGEACNLDDIYDESEDLSRCNWLDKQRSYYFEENCTSAIRNRSQSLWVVRF